MEAEAARREAAAEAEATVAKGAAAEATVVKGAAAEATVVKGAEARARYSTRSDVARGGVARSDEGTSP